MFKKRIALLVSVSFAVSLFAGCGKNTAPEVSDMGVAAEESAGEEAKAETEEQTEETDEQVAEEVEEVAEGPQSVAQWAKSLDKTEPIMTIWNDITKEGKILENEKQYEVKEGDVLVLCHEEGERGQTAIKADIIQPDYGSTTYFIYNILEIPEKPTKIEIDKTLDGVEYAFIVYLVAESGEADIEVPTDCDYYLTESGKTLLGVNTPEGFSYAEQEYATGIYFFGNGESITIYVSPREEDIYNGTSNEIVDDNQTYTYSEKGTYDTIYGSAKLYDEVTSFSDSDGTVNDEVAILNIQGNLVRIVYDSSNYDYDTKTWVMEHDITWVLQQLFE